VTDILTTDFQLHKFGPIEGLQSVVCHVSHTQLLDDVLTEQIADATAGADGLVRAAFHKPFDKRLALLLIVTASVSEAIVWLAPWQWICIYLGVLLLVVALWMLAISARSLRWPR
jgi:hypothetical protein